MKSACGGRGVFFTAHTDEQTEEFPPGNGA